MRLTRYTDHFEYNQLVNALHSMGEMTEPESFNLESASGRGCSYEFLNVGSDYFSLEVYNNLFTTLELDNVNFTDYREYVVVRGTCEDGERHTLTVYPKL